MYRFLLSWRWLRLAALVVVLAVCFLFLARWQWHRLESKRAQNAVLTHNTRLAPAPVGDVLAVGRPLAPDDQWRPVTVTGRYDRAHEFVVRSRVHQGTVGFDVITPVRLADGTGVLVDRGWVRATGAATVYPSVPAPPPGQVTVVGRARNGHIARIKGVPPSKIVSTIDVGEVSAWAGYPMVDGYLELTAQTPPAGASPVPVDLPTLSEGPHLAYAVQWVFFALLAVGGFVVLARQEARGTGWPGPGGTPEPDDGETQPSPAPGATTPATPHETVVPPAPRRPPE